MQLDGTILEIDTKFVDPLNYALSVDNLKESLIANDNLHVNALI